MHIQDKLTKILHDKINKSGITEFKSPEARALLVKLSREAVQELQVTGPDKKFWENFCEQVFQIKENRNEL